MQCLVSERIGIYSRLERRNHLENQGAISKYNERIQCGHRRVIHRDWGCMLHTRKTNL